MNESSNETRRPDLDGYAVPVSVEDGGATGFLGRRAGRVALYTAAHNLHVAKPRGNTWEIEGWSWLVPTLYVHPTLDEPGLGLRVYSTVVAADGTEERVPLFSWLEPGDGMVRDAVCFDLTDHPELLEACTGRFDVVDLDAAADHLDEGDPLICVGLPGWADSARTWPYCPAETCTSRFVRVDSEGHIKERAVPKTGSRVRRSSARTAVSRGCTSERTVESTSAFFFEHVRLISPRDRADL